MTRFIFEGGGERRNRTPVDYKRLLIDKLKLAGVRVPDHGSPEYGCPAGEYQFALKTLRRYWSIDFTWMPERVAVEYEGGIWGVKGGKKCVVCGQTPRGGHNVGGVYLKNVEKYNQLAIHGFILIRAVPNNIEDDSVIRQIKQALMIRSGLRK